MHIADAYAHFVYLANHLDTPQRREHDREAVEAFSRLIEESTMGQVAQLLAFKNKEIGDLKTQVATLTTANTDLAAKEAADAKALADLTSGGHVIDDADVASVANDPDLAASTLPPPV